MSVVEDVLVGRAEFGVSATDESLLSDEFEPLFDIVLPNVQGRRRREEETLVNLFGFVGRERVVETRVANALERLLEGDAHRIRLTDCSRVFVLRRRWVLAHQG